MQNNTCGFVLAALTPEIAAKMNPEEQVILGRQIVRALYKMCGINSAHIEELENGDIVGLRRLYKALEAETKRLSGLFPIPKDPRLKALMADLKTSSLQLPAGVAMSMSAAKGNKSQIVPYHLLNETKLAEKRGYRVDGTKVELADNLVMWLRERGPKESWEDAAWVLDYSNGAAIDRKRGSALALHSPWPPDPENDIVLQTYLEVLGWRMVQSENKIFLSF